MAATAAAAAAPPPASGPSGGLNVVALVSGGKDSIFSAMHCLHNGHHLVALANLYPADDKVEVDEEAEEQDLNSFMYQTVGHQAIPLYAEATGIPLHRRAIVGGAVQSGKDYSSAQGRYGEDETESMIPLLRSVIAAHPEANALSAGAILSTYQRTRVESVAVRLGLTPLAYLWKFPVLPSPPSLAPAIAEKHDDAQLLVDMATAGLKPVIIKVASGGLDESFLWEDVTSPRTVARVKRAMGRFGVASTGAVLGEGGEFETLVVDGPRRLFKKRLVVQDEDRVVVREGGGSAWVKIRKAVVEEKPAAADEIEDELAIRSPNMLDERFEAILRQLKSGHGQAAPHPPQATLSDLEALRVDTRPRIQDWAVVASQADHADHAGCIEQETAVVMDQIRSRLEAQSLSPNSIINTIIILRDMSDFPTINKIYGSLFTSPNPPSRVTISCGGLLPAGCNIAIYLTIHSDLKPSDRQGLHVQSRSYWAPANIGPYSQAISVPVASLLTETNGDDAPTARLVHIAGQIPLIPATMELPSGADSFGMQLALSLQHLWRIGVETGVQWWASGAVYFPHKGRSTLSVKGKALLAWKAWSAAHEWSPASDDDEEDDDETGPDLWDRTHNPQYMSYAGDGAEADEPLLPDWSVFRDRKQAEAKSVPFFFAVEVEELPRSAEAEWHAHAGLGQVGASSVRIHHERHDASRGGVFGASEISHCILKAGTGLCLHSVVATELSGCSSNALPDLEKHARETHQLLVSSLTQLAKSEVEAVHGSPYLLYADTTAFTPDHISHAFKAGLPIIPCASMWGPQGIRYATVALHRNVLTSKMA